jgi:peptide/nickel transport system permease protein
MTELLVNQVETRPRRRTRRSLSVWLSFAGVGAIALSAVAGGWLAPQDPGHQDILATAQPPSADHWLGTDGLGRDVFSRVLDGAFAAVSGPLVVALGAAAVGIVLGLLAGYLGGWVDACIMRVVDVLYALPAMLVILVLVGLVGQGYWSAVGLLVFLYSPGDVRLIRSAVIGQRNLPYIEAARTTGVRPRRVMFVHLLPNVLPTVVAGTLLDFVSALVGLSSLSFLGVGTPPGSTDWGRMLSENRDLLDINAWAALTPALLIVVAGVSMTVLGDWAYARMQKGQALDD